MNKLKFPDVSSSCFSVNGGVEVGDSILAFMPHESATLLREKPGIETRERLDHELHKHETSDKFYKPKLDPERTEGDDYASAGSMQEGRDF